MAFMGPKNHAVIAFGAGELGAGCQHPFAQALAARIGGQKEQAQLRGLPVGPFHAKNGAQAPIPLPGDLGAFAGRIMAVDEIGQNAGDKRLETRVKPFVAGVKLRMLLDQPPGIPWRQVA